MMANPILDKISKLNAEIEQLRAENSHLRRIGVDRLPAEILALQAAALADLRAENERLHTQIAMQAIRIQVLEAVRNAEQGYRLSLERKELAVGVVLETLQSQQDLIQARLDYALTVGEWNKAQYRLKFAVGE